MVVCLPYQRFGAYAEARNLFRKEDTQSAVTASDMLILHWEKLVATEKIYPYNKAKNWDWQKWVNP